MYIMTAHAILPLNIVVFSLRGLAGVIDFVTKITLFLYLSFKLAAFIYSKIIFHKIIHGFKNTSAYMDMQWN